MRVAAMLRVKNEARWIKRVVEAALRVCQRAYVLDDHSTDGTFEILDAMPNVCVYPSPFEGLDETRDKDYILGFVNKSEWDWVLAVDGDEELLASDAPVLLEWMQHSQHHALTLQVIYLWNDDQTIRTDGVYSRMCRPSAFRPSHGERFVSTNAHGNLHCTNVPYNLIHGSIRCPVRLLHYGYMHQDDRLRKFAYYNDVDPGNRREDYYRHIVQGDVPDVPADAQLKHAGPLTLEPISSLIAA